MYRPDYIICARHFSYDPGSGVIRWRVPTAPRIKAGSVAGSKNDEGYLRVSFKGGVMFQHRLAWLLHYGSWPDGDIDHINRKRDDNRIENLRVATPSENARNREYRKPGQMRHGGKGITFNKKCKKWQVQVHSPKKGRSFYGGVFSCLADALEKASDMRMRFDV